MACQPDECARQILRGIAQKKKEIVVAAAAGESSGLSQTFFSRCVGKNDRKAWLEGPGRTVAHCWAVSKTMQDDADFVRLPGAVKILQYFFPCVWGYSSAGRAHRSQR